MTNGPENDLIGSFGDFISAWDFSSPPAVLVLILAALYIVGSARLAMRTTANTGFWGNFAAGLTGFALLTFALAGPLDVYAADLFAMSAYILDTLSQLFWCIHVG